MAFKKVTDYNQEKFNGLFLLRNDGDFADVVIMYRSVDDVLVADTHYIKSADYSGYVQCVGRGCPACGKNIRVQTKLFIPLYNLSAPNGGEIQFWDRTMRFENQLQQDVFAKYPNPSEFVFRITRKGAAGDVNTVYTIQAVGRNTMKTYDQILLENNATFPEYYESICKDASISELTAMLSSSATGAYSNGSSMPEYSYQATPRVAFDPNNGSSAIPPTNNTVIPEYADDEDDDDDIETTVAVGADDMPAYDPVTANDVPDPNEELDEPVQF